MIKVLLTGNLTIAFSEFFTHMADMFECMSTSLDYNDIQTHIKYFKPEIFIYCLKDESKDDMSMIARLKPSMIREKLHFVIYGDDKDCNVFSDIYPDICDLIITRPMSLVNVRKELSDLLSKKAHENETNNIISGIQSEISSVIDINSTDINLTKVINEMDNRRKHILVVDDDIRMLKLIKTYLYEKYDIATAINGAVALKFLETKKTDLILLDYEMPGDNGPAVLSKIRKNPATANLPVIFLTGVSEKDKIQEVLSMKPQGYILKPVSRINLYTNIKNVIG